MSDILPFTEKGSPDKTPIVFLAGFPDNELSGWGKVIPEELGKDYRLIFLCLPGYQYDNKQFKPWGYSFDEILTMLHATLTSLGVTKSKFNLVAHDWGSFIGTVYENQHPELVRKLVLLDVGLLKAEKAPIKDILVILLYQFWFATAYIISQIFGNLLGDIAFKLSVPVLKVVGPCPHDRLTVPLREMTVQKCYPYYHFWRGQVLRTLRAPVYPSCPLLFMYGTRKNCMFHDAHFLDRIRRAAPESRERAFDAGHWFAKTHGEEVAREIQAFLEQ